MNEKFTASKLLGVLLAAELSREMLMDSGHQSRFFQETQNNGPAWDSQHLLPILEARG